MKLQIKTLSPLHIGNGEKYNGMSYISNKDKVSFYDSTKVMENITSGYSDRFVKWVEQRIFEIEKLEQQRRNERNEQRRKDITQLLRATQKKLSIKEFIESTIQNVAVRSKFNNNISYSVEAKTQVYNNVDIDCFIKQNHKPYIPGTEIKGAIRTAVLYTLLNKDSYLWSNKPDWSNNAERNVNTLIEDIREFGKRHTLNITKVGNKRLERHMREEKRIKEYVLGKEMKSLQQTLQEKILRSINNTDAKYDLLKLLHIGDTELKEPSQCLFISDIEVKGTRPIKSFQELCKKDQIFTCQGFNLDNNKTILNKLNFRDEQKWVIADAKNILQCCYEFSNRLLEEELAYTQFPPKVKERLKAIKQENKPESPVIRIGKNEGYLSLTMGFLVKEKDKTLYDTVLCHATKNTSYTGTFPKTRRIVNVGNGEVDTCGWVKLSIVK